MSDKPIVLILGSGPRVGAAVAKKFANIGYSVALASRKATNGKTSEGYFAIQADLANPASLPSIFEAVTKELNSAPSVVIYNAATLTPLKDNNLFSISTENLANDLNVNTVSVYAAAREAVNGWAGLPAGTGAKKVFNYTGNKQNTAIVPMLLMTTLGVGKSATGYLIGAADAEYAKQGYRFYYADQRNVDGGLKGMQLDGEAHADFYAQLAGGEVEVPWHATFVKGKGYVKF